MPYRTNQEIFDIVSAHLLKQNERSCTVDVNGSDPCLYRGPFMMKCAIGCLIPDDKYEKKFEDFALGSPIIGPLICAAANIDPEHIELPKELQHIHDEMDPCCWAEQLRKTADEWKLTIPPELLHA